MDMSRNARPLRRGLLSALFVALALSTAVAGAKELLRGEVKTADGRKLGFRVVAEDREEIVGGKLRLGDAEFVIAKESRLGMIGAARFSEKGEKEFGEYAVLSSSFSDMTAKGRPWVKARDYVGCDDDYNTFVAVYRVYGVDRVNALGSTPYNAFTNDLDAADESVVYCLYSAPPVPTT
jgi:hypothetical protein